MNRNEIFWALPAFVVGAAFGCMVVNHQHDAKIARVEAERDEYRSMLIAARLNMPTTNVVWRTNYFNVAISTVTITNDPWPCFIHVVTNSTR